MTIEVAGVEFSPSDLAHLVNLWHQSEVSVWGRLRPPAQHGRLMWAAREFARHDSLNRKWWRAYRALDWALKGSESRQPADTTSMEADELEVSQ